MKGIRFMVVVSVLVLIVALVTGEAGQTQRTGASDPAALQPGTGPPGLVQQEEVQPNAIESYDASILIPATALKPNTSDVGWTSEGGCVYATSGDANMAWSAPLYLPDGSIVRYFKMYYKDLSSSADCNAYLTLYDPRGNIYTEWALSSAGPLGEGSDITGELDVVIDYDNYSYVINWIPREVGPNMQVSAFSVYYDTPWGLAFLPYVTNGD